MRGTRGVGFGVGLVMLVLALSAGAVAAAPAGAQPAQPGQAPVDVTVKPTKDEFAPSEPVDLVVTLTNRAATPCRLAATSDGTLVLTVIRDGKSVVAAFSPVTYLDGLAAAVDTAAQDVAPEANLSFALTAEDGPNGNALKGVTPATGGAGLAAWWPTTEAGRYTVRATYQMPEARDACTGVSRPAAATFTITAGGGGWWGPVAWGAPAALVLVLAVAVFLLRRRRVVGAAMVLTVAAAVLANLGQPPPARASIEIDDLGDPKNLGFTEATEACLSDIRSSLGADPIGVLEVLDRPNFKVIIKPTRGDSNSSHYDGRSVIKFNPRPEGTYKDNVPKTACATLYHELVHTYDNATDQLDLRNCKIGADGKPTRSGPEITEVRAVRAENHYRAAKGLPQRKLYGGLPLPPGKDPTLSQVRSDCGQGPDKPPTDKPPTHAEPPGGSDGDPHILTFDQRRYDFQAVGEFLLAKSDDVEVHVRQSPASGSRWVSVNSAIGLRIGANRLTFAVYDERREIRLDGTVTTFSDPTTRLSGGGAVAATDTGYTITWPDGTEADVAYIGYWGIRILLYPAAGHKGRFSGLLGNFNGDPADDLAVRDAAPLPAEPDHQQLYGRFADTWRLSQPASLLDYPAGTDTATYTDRSFPDKMVSADDLEAGQRESARRICTSLGVADAIGLRDCILDLAITGQPAFAVSNGLTEQQIAAATPPRIRPGETLRDGATVRGSIGGPAEMVTYQLDAGDATVLRLMDVTGEIGQSGITSLRITVDGPDASTSPGFTVTSTYQYKVRPGEAYTLRVERVSNDTGDYGFRLVTAKERRIPSTLGAITGRLDVPGRVDLYAFEATQPGRLRLTDTTGCDFTVAVVDDTPAPRVYTPANLCSGIDLSTLESGKRYLLIVWSDTAGTGDYSFRTTT